LAKISRSPRPDLFPVPAGLARNCALETEAMAR
jgi:hypothetical protein